MDEGTTQRLAKKSDPSIYDIAIGDLQKLAMILLNRKTISLLTKDFLISSNKMNPNAIRSSAIDRRS